MGILRITLQRRNTGAMDSLLYSADGLKALKLRLASTDSSNVHDFSPTFVYPIFGEQEVIYGYRDLAIKLYFTSGSLRNYLGITYEGKPLGPDRALDVEGTLYEFIPPDYTKSAETFNEWVTADEAAFKPVGTRIGEYAKRKKKVDAKKSKGKGKANPSEGDRSKGAWENCEITDDDAVVFEAHQTTFKTPGFKEYHRRMQIFVLLYIEGGSYIDEDDDRWEFVTLYEKRKTAKEGEFTYHFVGYTSLYAFFHWPDKTRLRLAQFVILPPYQGSGHGSTFYSLLYLYLLQRADIAELTIEDPSEAFQDMRDKVDYRTLVAADVFKGVEPSASASWKEETRREWKLATRQFARVLEMALRAQLFESMQGAGKKNNRKEEQEKEKKYRLLVKERLFRQNYELLADMENREKRETLQSTYDSIMDEYDRLLDQMSA